ncbi:MAG: hypothetical protein MJA82_06310 [Clostridia bacterium]|nr:hypothetical protein [Clostridia bacterium]
MILSIELQTLIVSSLVTFAIFLTRRIWMFIYYSLRYRGLAKFYIETENAFYILGKYVKRHDYIEYHAPSNDIVVKGNVIGVFKQMIDEDIVTFLLVKSEDGTIAKYNKAAINPGDLKKHISYSFVKSLFSCI